MHGIDKIKRITAAMLAILLLSSVTVSAFAEDGTQISNFAEEQIQIGQSDTAEASSQDENIISLSGGITYSRDRSLFLHTVENSSFGISVPDGAILTGTVSAELSPSLTGVLYKNGKEIADADLSNISAPGKYVLTVMANDVSQTVRVNFTILADISCAVKEYIMPEDFFVVSATLNGSKATYSQTYVDMSGDGEYDICYRSPKADIDMELRVTIDHTPPTATLSGITDGKANGPVTVSDMEEGASVHLIRNGNPTAFYGTIEETGAYILTVQDKAGNTTTYDFVVVTYANSSTKALIATAALLVLALAGYLVYYRKYMRVS